MKLGNRVTVTPSRPDACSRDGTPLSKLAGKRGEVDGLDVAAGWALVDGQLVNGVRQGEMLLREWIRLEDLEIG